MRVFKFLLPLVIVALAAATFVYFKRTQEEPRPLKPRDRAPTVSVQVVEKVNATPMVRVFGRVESSSVSMLTAAVEADVVEVPVLEGEAVTAGQLLVKMDDTDARLEIMQREAELAEIEALIESDRVRLESDRSALRTEKALLALIRKSVERAETLAKSRAGSEATLDEALQAEQRQRLAITQRQLSIDDFDARQQQLVARRERANATLERARRDLDRTRANAPFAGRVLEVLVSQGDRVNRGNQLLRLFDDTQLEVRAQVPGAHIPVLQQALGEGREVSAHAAHDGERISLQLHRLAADVEQGQGGVDAFFRSGDAVLPALGMTLEIQVELPQLTDVVVISPDALYGRDRVYVVVQDMLQAKSVRRLGEFTDENGRLRLILDGEDFSPGDRVMVSRLPQAVSGLRVSVSPQ